MERRRPCHTSIVKTAQQHRHTSSPEKRRERIDTDSLNQNPQLPPPPQFSSSDSLTEFKAERSQCLVSVPFPSFLRLPHLPADWNTIEEVTMRLSQLPLSRLLCSSFLYVHFYARVKVSTETESQKRDRSQTGSNCRPFPLAEAID